MSSNRGALESKISRRFLPFAAVGLIAVLATLIPPQPEDWTYVWIAAVLTIVIAAAGILVPWSRLPRWTYIVPPLAYFVVVALLRQANDGSVSGYAPLALLPVVWIALNLGRREVGVGIAVGASVFVLPLLVGDPASYPTGEWRRARAVDGGRRDRRLLRGVAHARQARADTRGARPRANDRRDRRRDARIDG